MVNIKLINDHLHNCGWPLSAVTLKEIHQGGDLEIFKDVATNIASDIKRAGQEIESEILLELVGV